ncbi:MAG TPA: TraM recognition domain-containing protein [Kineosporiaceae bacterium]|nr:TraM recognition domain-containing protein [Kineosporiaceae bacterium]
MPAPVRPSSAVAGISAQWPWLIVLVGAAVSAADCALWLAVRLANLTGGRGWTGPAWQLSMVSTAARGGTVLLAPGTSSVLVWTFTALITAGVGGALVPPAVWVARRVFGRRDPARSMASPHDMRGLTPKPAAANAMRLRPSLAPVASRGDVAAADRGIALGRLRPSGPDLTASWEDVILAVMAPRTGKTTCLAVPTILQAPSWVVATSNKADLWAATAMLRTRVGRVWTFDPQSIVYAERTWWWNPIAGVRDVASANRLAGHFVQEVRGERGDRDFWSAAAMDLLTCLLLAAARAGRDITQVHAWLADSSNPEAVTILTAAGDTSAAASLRGRQQGASDTREGIFETARTAVQCLSDDAIMRWVTPDANTSSRLEEFDVERFVIGTDSAYLLSKDGAGAAAPLVAAFSDAIMRAAVAEAERRGGRIDPPGVIVLDEAANVCRISDLPDLYSHLGSRGVIPITILQSYPQGQRVWGEIGMRTLWSAATIKLIGSGLDDARDAEDISRMIGEEDVDIRSTTWGDGRYSSQLSVRRQRILDAADVRALPRGTAILLATGVRAALLELRPWYTGPHAAVISAAVLAAEAELTRRARLH